MRPFLLFVAGLFVVALAVGSPGPSGAAQKAAKKAPAFEPTYPPKLPGGQEFVKDTSDAFLKPPAALKDGVTVARTAPTVEFAYFPGQTYPGKPWSAWGESTFANGRYYASVGDHLAPGGNAFVYEYDPAKHVFRQLADVRKLLNLPDGHYTPGKIHTKLTLGSDGWLYFATHRGSTKATTDAFHYQGDWIVRTHPGTGKSEVVVRGPVPKHCIPTGFLDPDRMIFYGGTSPGVSTGDDDGVRFFAYDVKAGKVVCDVPDGPARAMILSKSTGRVYYVPAKGGGLVRYDPARPGGVTKIPGEIGLRAASDETAAGVVYTVAQGKSGEEPTLFAFDTKTETIKPLGSAAVGASGYITALQIDPTGRYLYYIPGAHGGADKDGSPVVQYDTRTNARKVIAFLHPFYKEKYGVAVVGTYSYALSADGGTLSVTWNANRGGRVWDACALTVVHIPEAERPVK